VERRAVPRELEQRAGGVFNPGLVGNVFYDTNGQDFVLKGVETSLVAKPLRGVTLQGAASWNQSRQTNSPALVDNNPLSNNYGNPITTNCGGTLYLGTCSPVSNPFGPVGSPTANSPPMQFSLRARYDFNVFDYGAFIQAGAVHTGHSYTQAGANPTFAQAGSITTGRLRFEDPAYSTFDASVGVSKDAWTVAFVGENLGNSHAATFTSTDEFIVAQTPLRPRILGVTMSYKF
jgi:iron complex outermembrane receptor protein